MDGKKGKLWGERPFLVRASILRWTEAQCWFLSCCSRVRRWWCSTSIGPSFALDANTAYMHHHQLNPHRDATTMGNIQPELPRYRHTKPNPRGILNRPPHSIHRQHSTTPPRPRHPTPAAQQQPHYPPSPPPSSPIPSIFPPRPRSIS